MKKWIIAIVIVLLLIIVGSSSVYTIREDQYACVVRFSRIESTTTEAGLHFKVPFLHSVKYFSDATQLYDIPPSEVLTSDKQNMTVDCYVLWKIADPITFYQRLETDAEAEGRLDTMTYTALKNALGSLTQADIINMEDGYGILNRCFRSNALNRLNDDFLRLFVSSKSGFVHRVIDIRHRRCFRLVFECIHELFLCLFSRKARDLL